MELTQNVCAPQAAANRNGKSLNSDRLIVFARHPEFGKVKTRLIPSIGAQRATQLHRALMQKTLTTAREFVAESVFDLELRVADDPNTCISDLTSEEFAVRPQSGQNLGERLADATRVAFSEGAARVVLVGTDCPDLSSGLLQTAFSALSKTDLVIGPALDGGYYLIGMRTYLPEMFEDIDWGSEFVLEQTKLKVRQLGMRFTQIAPQSDVDRVEDLIVCRRHTTAFRDVFPKTRSGLLTVVLPTLNEEKTLDSTLRVLSAQSNVEVVVADGGSYDRTIEIANRFSTTVVSCRAGRGRQMNAGAAVARGEALLFLHADTALPEYFQERIWSILNSGAIAGSFRLGISGKSLGLRMVEAGANFRSEVFQMPYGDQGLFIKSQTFFKVGGYRQWSLMEDFELCRRLRKLGRVVIAPESVTTSARRWNEMGIIRNTLLNQIYITAFRLGVSPERLARWYRARKSKKTSLANT